MHYDHYNKHDIEDEENDLFLNRSLYNNQFPYQSILNEKDTIILLLKMNNQNIDNLIEVIEY